MEHGKPQKQALAIAYSVKRKSKKAAGGSVESGSKDMNMAEGGSVSVPQQKRPMPENTYDDSKSVSRNSGNKPPKDDQWTDQPTVKQAQSNNGRMVKPIKRASMVPTNAFSTRLYDEEADLQSSASPGPYGAQPPRHDDEEDAKKQGSDPDMAPEHSTGRKPYAKGGKVESKDYADGDRDHDDGLHLQASDSPSEDEGASHARSRNEEGPNRQGPSQKKEDPHSLHSLMFEDDQANEDHDMEMNPAHGQHSADDSESQPDSPRDNDYYDDDGHSDSIAAAIMAKRQRMHEAIDSGARDLDEAVKMAEGGEILSEGRKSRIKSHGSMDSDDSSQVDLSRNADEDANEEDQASFESLMKENYSESEGLDQLDQPEDSNMKGDSEEEASHDRHDRVSAIRSKMKKRQFSQR